MLWTKLQMLESEKDIHAGRFIFEAWVSAADVWELWDDVMLSCWVTGSWVKDSFCYIQHGGRIWSILPGLWKERWRESIESLCKHVSQRPERAEECGIGVSGISRGSSKQPIFSCRMNKKRSDAQNHNLSLLLIKEAAQHKNCIVDLLSYWAPPPPSCAIF